MKRRRLLAATASAMGLPVVATLSAGAAGLAWAAPGDTPPLARLLLGAPAGGVGDLLARKLADKLRGAYAQSVIVENKPGAGGQLAVAALKTAPADGSVLLLTPSSLLSIFPFTYKTLPYKPETDLAPVALVAWSAMAFAVGPGVPEAVRSFHDFIAWARANPAQASYGSPAAGSIPHLLTAAIAQHRQLALTHVAYRGSSNALADLRGGTLPAHCGPLGVFLPQLKAGHIRVLAVSGERRSPWLPEVPTFRELGEPLSAREWYGFFLPGAAPRDVVRRSAAALRQALAGADMADALAQFGLEAANGGPDELAALIRADADEWRSLIRKLGFTAES